MDPCFLSSTGNTRVRRALSTTGRLQRSYKFLPILFHNLWAVLEPQTMFETSKLLSTSMVRSPIIWPLLEIGVLLLFTTINRPVLLGRMLGWFLTMVRNYISRNRRNHQLEQYSRGHVSIPSSYNFYRNPVCLLTN